MLRFKTIEEAEEIIRISNSGSNEDLVNETPEDRIRIQAFRLVNDQNIFSRLYHPSAERRAVARAYKGVETARICDNPILTVGKDLCFRG